MEIVLQKVFTALKITSASSGPDIAIFKRFREQWPSIDHKSYQTATDTVEIQSLKEGTLQFALSKLEMSQPRDDYREFLELAVIFVGGTPVRGIHIQAPGALHSARWMARVLYCYKIWMFRAHLKLRPAEEHGMFQFLLFVSDVYIRAWFDATMAAGAPENDLRFLKQLAQYSNPVIRQAAMTAFSRHLWYLSEVMVGLALFDSDVELEQKKQMVANMQNLEGSEDPPHRLDANGNYTDKQLSSFVTTNTRSLLTILRLPDSFLKLPPEAWNDDKDFQACIEVVGSLKVVNNSAERGVKLIQDFNDVLTKDEDQKQFLLQIVQEHRKLYPDSNKQTILAGLTTGMQMVAGEEEEEEAEGDKVKV
jgi:hypothetical protein